MTMIGKVFNSYGQKGKPGGERGHPDATFSDVFNRAARLARAATAASRFSRLILSARSLTLLREFAGRHCLNVIGYYLMSKHVHLVVSSGLRF